MEEGYKPVQATFTAEDPRDIKRLAMADKISMCLWDIANNVWRKFKYDDKYDYEPYREAIIECIHDHGILIDELTE